MADAHLELLESVLRTTGDVASQVRPEDLGRPTPCEELDVRALLAHVIGWQRVFAGCAAELPPSLEGGSPTYATSHDPADDLRKSSAALLATLRAREDESITLPYRGATNIDTLVTELVAEMVIHTWDLATALGIQVAFDDHEVSVAHDGLSLMLKESFAAMGFRAPQTTTPSSELERLLRRSGRSPGAHR